jgi:hypothetical protein
MEDIKNILLVIKPFKALFEVVASFLHKNKKSCFKKAEPIIGNTTIYINRIDIHM